MTENTGRPPKTEDSIDDLGDPDATNRIQEQTSADDTNLNNDVAGDSANEEA